MSDDDKKRESHIGDMLAHAMIPPTDVAAEPAPPPAEPEPPMQSAIAQDEAVEEMVESMSPDDPRAIQSGETVAQLERLWPLLWLAMLTVVCVIGIYNAVRMLP